MFDHREESTMSTITQAPPRRVDVLHPLVASAAGALTFAVTMTAGYVFDLNSEGPDAPATTVTDVLTYAGLVLAAVALAVWLGMRARAGTPDRLGRYALGTAIGAAATFVAFWSGWPHVLGATALVLALEHRRRVGGFTVGTAISALVGTAALAASAFTCVVG
jgi:hypothetical protein